MNVLFLLIDCLRADVCQGEGRTAVTPNLDALRRQGTSFTQAISVAGNTPVCLASLFTGLYPFVHGIRPISLNRFHLSDGKLDQGYPTLAEILGEHGYVTSATVTGPPLHVTGLDRGFESYTYREGRDVYLHGRFGDELTGLLRQHYARERPWFLFTHLWEIHAPRQVVPEFNSPGYGRNRYERAVSSLDHQLGRVFREVDFGNTLVIIHGDHGEGTESLFEFLLHPRLHDLIGIRLTRLFYSLFFKWIHQYRSLQSAHGLNLYDYMVRVPLILVGPGVPAGRVIPDQVSQVDVLPTLVEMLRAPVGRARSIHGRSLCPLVAGEQLEERPLYMEAYSGKSVSRRYLPARWVRAGTFAKPPALVAIRTPAWKCIWVPEDPRIQTELYHLTEDPSEVTNLAEARPDMAGALKAHLARLQSIERPEAMQAGMTREEQEALEEKLRELGYI